ncbi:MAG: ABC transporter substrate-binding protein, partial [Nanoarchaeota archaeon]
MRLALAHAIDINSAIANILGGAAETIASPIPPGSAGFNPDIPKISHDVEAAKKLLDEAGWKDSDKDGIRDFIDKCPCTFGESTSEGCPAAFKEEEIKADKEKFNSEEGCGESQAASSQEQGSGVTTTVQKEEPIRSIDSIKVSEAAKQDLLLISDQQQKDRILRLSDANIEKLFKLSAEQRDQVLEFTSAEIVKLLDLAPEELKEVLALKRSAATKLLTLDLSGIKEILKLSDAFRDRALMLSTDNLNRLLALTSDERTKILNAFTDEEVSQLFSKYKTAELKKILGTFNTPAELEKVKESLKSVLIHTETIFPRYRSIEIFANDDNADGEGGTEEIHQA